MARINFTKALATEYQRLYDTCELHPEQFTTVDKFIDKLEKNKNRYENVSRAPGLP